MEERIENQDTPYQNLKPDLILNAIESLGFVCDGSLHALNSYENRVYQVGVEESKPWIAKFYRPKRWSRDAILEEHQFALELMEHEIPVVAPWVNEKQLTLHSFESFDFALFPRWGGRALELDNFEQLEWMGRFIGRLHAVGSCQSFNHRTQLNVKTYGHEPTHFLIQHKFIPSHLARDYQCLIAIILKRMEQIFDTVGKIQLLRLHGDMHIGNVLWDDQGPHIVDLDDCLMGPAIQDIWMLLSGDEDQMNIQLEYILRGYRKFFDFNLAQLQLIEVLRTLRMLHYSAWLAKRWQDPTFPISFPWFNTEAYWHEQLRHLNEQAVLLK